MSYFDSLVFEELKKLNKNMEKLVHGVNVLAGLESPGILNEAELNVLTRHIGPGIAGMSAEEAKAAGWVSPNDDHINLDDILDRADVEWYDDPFTFTRKVISRNPDAPLTDSEKDMLRRMWINQGLNYNVIFDVAEGE